MATGTFEIKKSMTLGSGEKVYRDKSITDQTVGVIDMSSDWAGSNKASYANADAVANLAYQDDSASVLVPTASITTANAATGSGGGVSFTGGSGKANATGVKLPTSLLPTTDMTHFLFTFWFKCSSTTGAISQGANYNFFYLGTGPGNDSTASAAVLRTGWSGGSSKTLYYPTELFVYGVYVTNPTEVNAALAALQGDVTQLSVEVIYDASTNLFYLKYYVNGVYIVSTSTYTPVGRVSATKGYVFTAEGTGAGIIDTSFYRARLDDLTSFSGSTIDIVALDYKSNIGYFS